MRKTLLGALFALSAIAPSNSVVAAEQQQIPEVICTGRHPEKPGFVCSDGTRLSLFGGVEIQEKGKTPHFTISRKLLKISTRIELQQCTGGRYTTCLDKPWDDIDFVSVENETDCIDKARFIAFEKWLRASRQGFAPSITWSCM